jgi:hypothetical protein
MKTIKLTSLKPNPNNPRYITKTKFEDLKRSIRDFPEMMALRPMVVDDQGTVLGGNMRLKALAELGYQDIPAAWVIKAKDLTEEQSREFVVKDNIGFGDWDWDILANDWADEPLGDWGLEVYSGQPNTEIASFDAITWNLALKFGDRESYEQVKQALAEIDDNLAAAVLKLLNQ